MTRDTGQLLDDAAAILESSGWCQKAMYDEHGRYCMMGAIRQAANSSPEIIPDAAIRKCDVELEWFLAREYETLTISEFNDTLAENAQEAIQALRDAAQYWREQQ